MKPWEKPCPNDYWDHKAVPRDYRDGVLIEPCPDCHGAGVIPITTDELLDALSAKFPDGFEFWYQPSHSGWCVPDAEIYGLPAPTDALRAALEAIG